MGCTGNVNGMLSVKQVAEIEGVSTSRVRQWINDDRYNIHAVKIRRTWYIPEEAYREFRKQCIPGRIEQPAEKVVQRRMKVTKNQKSVGDPWENLAHAIVKGIIKDYKIALRYQNEEKIQYCEKLLRSDWIRFLLGGVDVEYVIKRLEGRIGRKA